MCAYFGVVVFVLYFVIFFVFFGIHLYRGWYIYYYVNWWVHPYMCIPLYRWSYIYGIVICKGGKIN